MKHEIILASGSPRRRKMLEDLGYQLEVKKPEVEEKREIDEPVLEYLMRNALIKGESIAKNANANSDQVILSADTIVVLDGELLEKPSDSADACKTLQRLSDRSHEVWSAVAIFRNTKLVKHFSHCTQVKFGKIPVAAIEDYVATGAAADKAGSYGIQERIGYYVERINGSYQNIVGLPLYEVTLALRELGVKPDS